VILLATDWTRVSAIASFAAFGGTVLLAGVTLALVIVTKGMVDAAKKGLDDEWSREWARQRPVVYPQPSLEWVRGEIPRKNFLPLKNGGRGPALNVHGRITEWSEGEATARPFVAGTIAAGDVLEARIATSVNEWSKSTGLIVYSDLVGGNYEALVEFSLGPGNELAVMLHEARHVTPAQLRESSARPSNANAFPVTARFRRARLTALLGTLLPPAARVGEQRGAEQRRRRT
jgi:hypothetical protein